MYLGRLWFKEIGVQYAGSVIRSIVSDKVREWCRKNGYSKAATKRRSKSPIVDAVAKRVEMEINREMLESKDEPGR